MTEEKKCICSGLPVELMFTEKGLALWILMQIVEASGEYNLYFYNQMCEKDNHLEMIIPLKPPSEYSEEEKNRLFRYYN